MLRTGKEYLAGLRDGRVIYLGSERITDVTAHPGFCNMAQTIAELFDRKFDSASRSDLVIDQGEGAPFSAYFLLPRTFEDLQKRQRCHRHIAETTFGLLGRSPDHVASMVTGLAMEAETLGHEGAHHFSRNLIDYYLSARERDVYLAYAVLPARISSHGVGEPRGGLRIVEETRDGIVLCGVKALATAAMFADELWIGNLQPISTAQESEAITCVVACNAPGLELWSRKSFASSAACEFDSPLTWRYDEGDAVLVFNRVKVDWKHVFVHRNASLSSDIYFRTPAHSLANHQAAVRSCSKVRLLAGLAHRVTTATGSQQMPAVRELLGRIAALESALEAMVEAQVYRFDRWPSGGVSPNRRYVYAALNWCQEHFPVLIELLRELSGSGSFRFPASIDVLDLPNLKATFERFWAAVPNDALQQMQLFKLIWDITGSELAGRQQQYERFYAGPAFVVRGHSYREEAWEALDAVVTQLMARYPAQLSERLPPFQNGTASGS